MNTEDMDDVIVRAAIHPGIGMARVGDSKTDFFIGPEVKEPVPEAPGFYRDPTGALKRQAARFRVYGLNASGRVVSELTADNASVTWTVHLANTKALWYQFQAAMDIPDTASLSMPLRNADVLAPNRGSLSIDPGPRTITGISVSGGSAHTFDTGKFKDTVVPLGEIRTDEAGRLMVLGGTGQSASPSNAPIIPPGPNGFNNADDWYDDVSDGPVTAEVTITGRSIPIEPAWVIVGPPNYAPDIIGWRTMYDLLTDLYTSVGWLPVPERVSFTAHVLPILRRLSNLQWVNQGFAAMFGMGGPMNFENPDFIAKLAHLDASRSSDPAADPYKELRQTIMNAFRPQNQPAGEPRLWPWIYGDAFGSSTATSALNVLATPDLQMYYLTRWVAGEFIGDWDPSAVAPKTLEDVPLGQRPAMLDEAALHFCLADAFHPGCEMTWPVRHSSMYSAPFRIRHRPATNTEPDLGANLTAQNVLQLSGPLYAQGPGGITRWMGLPWQGDTAMCRSGYDADFDPYLPTFWAARAPNQVLSEDDYQKVIDTSLPAAKRIAALNHREQWLRSLKGSAPVQMQQMVSDFGKLGVVEARPGVKGDPLFPETLFVESLAPERLAALKAQAAKLAAAAPAGPRSRAQQAGWESEEQLREFRNIRFRQRS